MIKPLQLDCYATSLRQASRALGQVYEEGLKPLGLRITQYSILRVIDSVPRPLRVIDLAGLLVIDDTTLTRSLRIMQKSGWIELIRSETDGREKTIRLTPTGRILLRKAHSLWEQVQRDVEQRIGKQSLAESRKAIQAITLTLSRS